MRRGARRAGAGVELLREMANEEGKPAMATTNYPHIEIRPEGVPYLTGTQTKVIEVVLDRLGNHWDADEIHRQHPHLSLLQIHIALAYYYDHQEEMDREIERQRQYVAALRAQGGESPVRQKLKALGLLP